MNDLSNVIKKSRDIAKQMDIIALMTDVARTRSRLTMQMVYVDDIFERDEIAMALNTKATEFALLRQSLLETGLTAQDKAILDQQSGFIRIALSHQRQAADLALSDHESDRKLAGTIVINEVYPLQGVIVDHFMKLLEVKKSQLDSIAEQSLTDLEGHTQFNRIMITFILLGSMTIIAYMVINIRAIEKQLVIEKEKAQVTLRSIGDGVITVNKKAEIEYLNQVALSYIAESETQLLGQKIGSVFDKRYKDGQIVVWKYVEQLLQHGSPIKQASDIRFVFKSKPSVILKATVSPIVDNEREVSGAVISFSDITKSQALLNKIQHQASHDALTGLYNRRAFEERVKHIIEISNVEFSHTFCIIDLDQFKIVNDSAGHTAGDELLKQLAKIMKPVLGKDDMIARLGGDEFGLFLYDVRPDKAVTIAENLLNAVQSFGFYWENNVYRISASIGMVNVPADIIDYEYLFQTADSACYIAKNEGRNRIHLMPIDAEVLSQKAEESERLQHLTQTLEQGQFLLYSQNIQPLSTRARGLNYIEILLRMKHKDGSIIPPMAFIPMSERYGLMADIDHWVLKTVCKYISGLPSNDAVFAVNLSGQTLSSDKRLQDIVDVIREYRIARGRLCLEVTETVAIANLNTASAYMATLRALGCYIALDDFGSGLSSFSYLNALPLDFLKIDGVFVKSMEQDEASTVMIEAIHYVGEKLGLLTIAEYVEDEVALATLQQIGIDMAQGYYFDKPSELIAPG